MCVINPKTTHTIMTMIFYTILSLHVCTRIEQHVQLQLQHGEECSCKTVKTVKSVKYGAL